jgi:hypothetical protein
MKAKFLLSLIFIGILFTTTVRAQESDSADSIPTTKKITYHLHFYAPAKPKQAYFTSGANGSILSFADVKDNGVHVRNIPRFTVFFNIGTNYNYDVSNHFGFFSGLNLKNIGLITEIANEKLKRRVYTAGVPLGFKVGDLRGGTFLFFGGEYDLAFNYKEKFFLDGDKQSKFNEWFSDRTDLLMPSLFAGFRFSPGFGLKVQYYPNNFFNKDFTETINNTTVKPYEHLKANLMFVTLGYNFGIKAKHKYYKAQKNKKSKLKIEKELKHYDNK